MPRFEKAAPVGPQRVSPRPELVESLAIMFARASGADSGSRENRR